MQMPFLVSLEKTPTQEEYIRGSMPNNPYQSTDVGELMRDVKNKVRSPAGGNRARPRDAESHAWLRPHPLGRRWRGHGRSAMTSSCTA